MLDFIFNIDKQSVDEPSESEAPPQQEIQRYSLMSKG